MSPSAATQSALDPKLDLTLDRESTQEIKALSEKTGIPPFRLIGIALRVLIEATEARGKKRRVLITSDAGYPIKEIVVPTRKS